MKVNNKARIRITHSKRFGQELTKTWAALGFEWFGLNNPAIPSILESLHTTGEAQVTDASGTVYLKALDPMYIEETGQQESPKIGTQQFDIITAKDNFALKVPEARGRACQVKTGDEFTIVNPAYQHHEKIEVRRNRNGSRSVYPLTPEQFKQIFG